MANEAAFADETAAAGGERDARGAADVPADVAVYLRKLARCLAEQDVYEIHRLYDYHFPDLTERYFRERNWPSDDVVAELVGPDNKLFLMLYRELYYRYLYSKMQRGPTLDIRYNSYENYQEFFSTVLHSDEPVALTLPDQWLWDIIDEFIYQFQSFSLYKASPNKRAAEELDDLVQMERATWNLYPVLNILYSLVDKSQINEQLQAERAGRDVMDFATDFAARPLYYKLGYFALIGLLRLHVLLGDYEQALRVVENIPLDASGLFNMVPTCLVTLHYYVAFAHMMTRRYDDAIRVFVNCLLYIQRTRNLHTHQQRSALQYDVISKTNEQIFQLLGICLTIAPQRVDESVLSQMTERLGERWVRMSRGELADMEAAYQIGCPKFLAPTTPVQDMVTVNCAKEPLLLQSRVFMDEMQQQVPIAILRGYLKLYSTMPLAKLVSFAELKQPELLSQLLAFKHKLCDATREPTGEDDEATPDLDFYIDKDMIHIADTRVGRRVCEYFIKHIQKLIELNKNLAKLKFERPAATVGESRPSTHHR